MSSTSFTNRARAEQLIDFRGLQFGKCSPTDIDMSMDWQGKTFVFVEIKGAGKPITAGQKYHLEGLCKGLTRGGKTAWGKTRKYIGQFWEKLSKTILI